MIKLIRSEAFKNLMAAKREDHQISPLLEAFFSEDSMEVISHFGYEAADLLNSYCNDLEDMLMEQRDELFALRRQVANMKREMDEMKVNASVKKKMNNAKKQLRSRKRG